MSGPFWEVVVCLVKSWGGGGNSGQGVGTPSVNDVT